MATLSPSPSPVKSREDLLISFLGDVPNLDAAIIALSFYCAATVALLAMTVRTRGWFMITAVITAFLEVGGFAARVGMIKMPTNNALVAMQCLLIISPVLLAIIEYVAVGKLIKMSEAGRSSRWMRWQVYAFTGSDIFSLLLQGSGGAMLAQSNTSPSSAETGRKLLLAGLAFQIGFFTMFIFLTLFIHIKPRFGFRGNAHFSKVFYCLYITIALLYIRNVFRIVEFVQGWRGYLAVHEVYFYVFDFVPVFFTFVFFTVWHYGRWLKPGVTVEPAANSVHPTPSYTGGLEAGRDSSVAQPHKPLAATQLVNVSPLGAEVPLQVVTIQGTQRHKGMELL